VRQQLRRYFLEKRGSWCRPAVTYAFHKRRDLVVIIMQVLEDAFGDPIPSISLTMPFPRNEMHMLQTPKAETRAPASQTPALR
jgi:hypothetical protein